MSILCSACSTPMTALWRFCPQCGAAAPEHTAQAVQSHEVEPAPVRKAFGGLMWGVIVAPIMIIVGALLCLTGLGAFLGIPLIVGGVLAPLAGPMIGLGELKGACPWCGAAVTSVVKRPGFYCHACSHRIAIRRGRFEREDTCDAADGACAP